MSDSVVARQVYYSGAVQGVGFRATALRIARRFAVTGWIRNLRDGRVELHVEGVESEVESFLRALRDYWGNSITDEQVQSATPSGKYTHFDMSR